MKHGFAAPPLHAIATDGSHFAPLPAVQPAVNQVSTTPQESLNQMFPTPPTNQPQSLDAAINIPLDDSTALVRDLSSSELMVCIAAASKLHKLYLSTATGALDSAAVMKVALDQCVASPKPSSVWLPMLKVLGSACAATGAYGFPAGRLNDGINVVVSSLSGDTAPSPDEVQAGLALANVLPAGGLDTLEQIISKQTNAVAIRALLSSELTQLHNCGLNALSKCARPNWVQMGDVNRLIGLLSSTNHNTVQAVINAIVFAAGDARVGSIFLSKNTTQKLLELALHHPNPSVASTAAKALPQLLGTSPASTILQLLNTEWHQIEGLLPASPSAASAVVTLLAMLSPKDLASATGLVSSALPILLKQQCNEQSMRDDLSKAIANAVYEPGLRALLEEHGAMAWLASDLVAPTEHTEVSSACTSALEALIVFLTAPRASTLIPQAIDQIILPTVQLLASLAHLGGGGGSKSRIAAANSVQLLGQALLIAPEVAIKHIVDFGGISALVGMLRAPVPRDPSSCALRGCAAHTLCPLALQSESRQMIRESLTSGEEGFQGCMRSWDDQATLSALEHLQHLLALEAPLKTNTQTSSTTTNVKQPPTLRFLGAPPEC